MYASTFFFSSRAGLRAGVFVMLSYCRFLVVRFYVGFRLFVFGSGGPVFRLPHPFPSLPRFSLVLIIVSVVNSGRRFLCLIPYPAFSSLNPLFFLYRAALFGRFIVPVY